MASKSDSGSIFGIPYNFQRPSLRRLIESYWQPGQGMLVEKPFGVGYTLNLANWRSWIVIAVAGALLWNERQRASAAAEAEDEEPIEVVVDDD